MSILGPLIVTALLDIPTSKDGYLTSSFIPTEKLKIILTCALHKNVLFGLAEDKSDKLKYSSQLTRCRNNVFLCIRECMCMQINLAVAILISPLIVRINH
jgi:hypothetical protein